MIRKIKFSNFYSFKGEQEIDFLSKKKKSYDYFQSKSGDQITKIAGFIGGNASGKTNVMRLFSFLRYFVCESSKNEFAGELDIASKTFFNNTKTSNFHVEFEFGDAIYFYTFSIKNNSILGESLFTRKISKGARKITLYSRVLGKIEFLNEDYFKKFQFDFLKNIRADISLIAFLKAHYNIEIINDIFTYFEAFKTNINERGELNNVMHQIETIELYLQDDSLKKEMEDLVRRFDLGLNSFAIKKEMHENRSSMSIQGLHRTKEKNNALDFSYESRGTRSLFFTLANILSGLKHSNVIIIDEIESGFHPEALNKIISYFIDENNSKKAQIIFSSHSLGFLNKLEMHQIYLVEKNDESESRVFRLNQVKDIRPDENFGAKYMAGAYGAFPKIRV